LVLFLQKKNTSSFSEEKEAKRLLFLEFVDAAGRNAGWMAVADFLALR
jgi:hypothetical protein